MRIFPIAIALGLTLAGPALAASESAKMKGQDQNATEPHGTGRNRRRCTSSTKPKIQAPMAKLARAEERANLAPARVYIDRLPSGMPMRTDVLPCGPRLFGGELAQRDIFEMVGQELRAILPPGAGPAAGNVPSSEGTGNPCARAIGPNDRRPHKSADRAEQHSAQGKNQD